MDTVSRKALIDAMSNEFTTYIRLGQREKAEEVKAWLEKLRAGTFPESEGEVWKAAFDDAEMRAMDAIAEKNDLQAENERLRARVAELEDEKGDYFDSTSETAVQADISKLTHNERFQLQCIVDEFGEKGVISMVKQLAGIKDGRDTE